MKSGSALSGRTILACLISFALGALLTTSIFRVVLHSTARVLATHEQNSQPSTASETSLAQPALFISSPSNEPQAQIATPTQVSTRLRATPSFVQLPANPSARSAPVPDPNPPAQHNFVAGSPTFTVKGKVYLRGMPPPEKPLPLDPQCAKEHPNGATTRFYVVGEDGGLADALVFISAGIPDLNWPMPQNPHVLTQRGCIYEPYVSAARAGQTIQIVNLSQVLHNVHFTPTVRGNREANYAQLPGGKPVELVLAVPELFVRQKCDVHPWEYAYVSTFSHPFFAITDEKGEFSLPSLPKGEYTLEAHHRKAGIQQCKVKIEHQPEPLMITFQLPEEI